MTIIGHSLSMGHLSMPSAASGTSSASRAAEDADVGRAAGSSGSHASAGPAASQAASGAAAIGEAPVPKPSTGDCEQSTEQWASAQAVIVPVSMTAESAGAAPGPCPDGDEAETLELHEDEIPEASREPAAPSSRPDDNLEWLEEIGRTTRG
jgi:hypothetical protein